jgi:hypothetical protein
MCHCLRLHFWSKISWCGHFLGWHFWDEMCGCGHFLGLHFGWKCLNVVTLWDFIFGWKFLDVVTFTDEISWMNDLMLKYLGCLGWNVLILTFHEMSWMNVGILTCDDSSWMKSERHCYWSLFVFEALENVRAWMSGDCIVTVAVAEKGERWQAHVQRIQAPPLLLGSSSSSSLWSRSEMRKRGDTTEATRETRYAMPYYCCFLEKWIWVSLHLLSSSSSSSSLYRSASNTIYISLKQRNDSSLVQQGSRSFQKIQSQLFCSEQFARWKQGILEDREREEEESEQE